MPPTARPRLNSSTPGALERAPHIGLNAQLLAGDATYRSAGIHRYIEALLQHLPDAAAGFRYTAFVPRRAQGSSRRLRQLPIRWPTHAPIGRILWEQFAQPGLALMQGLDLLHCLAFVSPILCPCPGIVTVYDLSFEMTPERFRSAHRRYLSTFTRLSCRRARRVIAISESTRADLARCYGLPLDRIDVAYPGVSPTFRRLPPSDVEAFRRRRGLPQRFILHLGTIEPRKNLTTLIRAFAVLKSPDVALALVGGVGWLAADVFSLIDELGVGERILHPGYVPDDELPLWYNAAEVLAYPSAYEGFGIPPAEAMACGTAVVTSNASSLPEVVGDAGLKVPAGDVEALAEALHQLLTRPDLRQVLAERGPRRASRFTWERTAQATVAAYRHALGLAARPVQVE